MEAPAALQLQLALSGRLVLPVSEQKDPLSISVSPPPPPPPPPPNEAAPSQHIHTDHSNEHKRRGVRYLLGRSKQQLEKIALSSEQVTFFHLFLPFPSHFGHTKSYESVRRKIRKSVMRMCFLFFFFF